MLIEPTPENEHDRRWGWLFPIANSLLGKVKKKSCLNLSSATDESFLTIVCARNIGEP